MTRHGQSPKERTYQPKGEHDEDDPSHPVLVLAIATLVGHGTASAQTYVADDWALLPSGLSAGDEFRLVFVTSTKRNASATSIADYNTFVQNRAAAGHTAIQSYSSGFGVVGCTADVDARDNTSTTHTSEDRGLPIYWLNGNKVADTYRDFYDGSWDDEANAKNESGTSRNLSGSNNEPWTGCNHNGTEAFANFTDSRALGASSVRVGRPNNSSQTANGPLGSGGAQAKSVTKPFYALSQVFTVGAGEATGVPTITGTAEVAQILTADVSGTHGAS